MYRLFFNSYLALSSLLQKWVIVLFLFRHLVYLTTVIIKEIVRMKVSKISLLPLF